VERALDVRRDDVDQKPSPRPRDISGAEGGERRANLDFDIVLDLVACFHLRNVADDVLAFGARRSEVLRQGVGEFVFAFRQVDHRVLDDGVGGKSRLLLRWIVRAGPQEGKEQHDPRPTEIAGRLH